MWKCCCCFDLRTGSIIIAVLQIVGSLGMLGGATDEKTCWSVLVGVAAGICLLIGAIKSNASAILVYLILAMIDIVLQVVVGILFVQAVQPYLTLLGFLTLLLMPMLTFFLVLE